MKVCLLNDSFPPVIDGVANVVVNYASIMTNEKLAEVMVGTPRYPDGEYSSYPYLVVPYQSFDTTAAINGYRAGNPLSVRSMNKMMDFSPDIIHVHAPFSSIIMGRILRHETKAPMVFSYHTKFDVDIARAMGNGFLKKETELALVRNIASADEVWVVSEGAGENLKNLGYEGEYRVMRNGVDFIRARADAEAVLAATRGYDLPAGVPVFLFVGRLMNYKGLPLICDALKILHENHVDFRMVFVGGGRDEEELRERCSEYGLDSKVIFTGPIHDREALRAWNTRADLFLFPSTYDTNGIVVREAAACGLASVLIKDSCASEGVVDGRNGYTIEETPEAMAALLERVSTDLDHVHDVGTHAMDEIYISWDESVREAARRYGEIIESRTDKPARWRRVVSDIGQFTSGTFLKLTGDILDEAEERYESARILQGELIGRRKNIVEELLFKMIQSDAGDPKRIQHFTKVYEYAHLIGVKEGLSQKEQFILDCAAILHDVGIHACEEKYGSCAGSLQEKEGPPLARDMLGSLGGFTRIETDRICYLVGHHHTYSMVDSDDYQILLEADFLVNAYEEGLPEDSIRSAREELFKTQTGIALLEAMFPCVQAGS